MATESNAMDVDEVEDPNKNELENQNPNPNHNHNHIINNAKRRKRTRDEMETDLDTDTASTTNNAIATKPQNNVKRRKITNKPKVKPKAKPKATNNTQIIKPMPQKWQCKFNEYQSIIISTHKSLQNEANEAKNTNKSLFLSEKVQNDLTQLNIDTLDDYIPLFCRLCYALDDSLSTLCSNIQTQLLNKTPNIADSIKNTLNDKIREIILKSTNRKVYGIAPPKALKTEEMIGNDIDSWSKCRVYQWTPSDIECIDKEYRLDITKCTKYSLIIRKYGVFCKKYESLSHNKRLNMEQKEKELQQIDDGIIIWKGKEAAHEKKQEQKQLQMKERKEKKEKMERLRKEKAEKKKKEKEEKDKLKKEKEKLKKEKEKQKKEKEKSKKEKVKVNTPQIVQKKTKQRKPSFLDRYLLHRDSPSKVTQDMTPYQSMFHPPKPEDILMMHNKSDLIQIKDDKICISDKLRYPLPTAIPTVFVQDKVDDMDEHHMESSADIDNKLSRMQIDDANNKVKLQWKYRYFSDDHRRCFFGIDRRYEGIDIDIKKLAQSPFKRVQSINYDEDDDEDVDDLENCDLNEEEADLDDFIANQEKKGLIRSDGFENDRFIVDSEDDEDGEALNDKDMMQNMAKSNELRDRLKDEYPIKFINRRQRGDEYDRAIVIHLPRINSNEGQLFDLTMKKGGIVVDDAYDVDMKHDKENDLEHLVEIENKKYQENEEKKKKKKEKMKKKKKEEKKRKKEEKKKNKKKISMKMEMDEDEDENEEDDVKMNTKSETPKSTKQNTLSNYFKITPKQNDTKKCNDKSKENETKKKKKRVVMCELVE